MEILGQLAALVAIGTLKDRAAVGADRPRRDSVLLAPTQPPADGRRGGSLELSVHPAPASGQPIQSGLRP